MRVHKKELVDIISSGINWLVILPLIILLAIDSYRNPSTIYKLLAVHSYSLVMPALFIVFVARIKNYLLIDPRLQTAAAVLGVAGLSTSTMVTLYEYFTSVNAAYAVTRLNQTHLCLLGIVGGSTYLVSRDNDWWRAHWKKVIFLVPYVLFVIAGLVRLFPFEVFRELVKEDHLIENAQFWVLIAGAVGMIRASLLLLRRKHLLLSLICAVSFLSFIFVAGDEIAWGQRVLGIEVSETVKEQNRQGELTVHNLYAFEWMVLYIYFYISLLGLIGQYLTVVSKSLKSYFSFIPSYLFTGYFLFPFIFYFMQMRIFGGIWQEWSELAELYFYAGVVGWSLLVAVRLARPTDKKVLRAKRSKVCLNSTESTKAHSDFRY